jgi:2-methylcitrate dehydratase
VRPYHTLVEDGMKSADENVKSVNAEEEVAHSAGSALGRRDLMKLGAGVVVTTLSAGAAATASAQDGEGGGAKARPVPSGVTTVTGTGYKNDANRLFGNGPMDNTSRQLVSFVNGFSESNLTGQMLAGISNTMLDSIAALIAGFDSEPGRIGARMGKLNQSPMKSTISGYGVVTNPESAAFANSCMIRHCDYNDGDPANGGHTSVIIPGILAIAEAVHATGSQTLAAITIGYEVLNGLGHAGRNGGMDAPYESVGTALACGKLMGLNEDRLANALSLALVPHIPLNITHVGALSHWKGCHSAMGVRSGVLAALLAREGMTGPAQPFEGRSGMEDRLTGAFKEVRLPYNSDGQFAVANFRKKRYPVEGNAQAMMYEAVPPIRAFAKADDIASIHVEMAFSAWQEIADPPKWDPRNRETADHSMAFLLAVGLSDGNDKVYIDSFTPKRYLEDASIRRLMACTTCSANPEFERQPQGRTRFTVRTKDGRQLVKDVFDEVPMTRDEIVAKFNRACDFMSVPADRRDRARETWADLTKVHDIADPMRDLGRFGRTLTV